ncbi:MAG: HlyD family type I secretion periplasmic adaptor subunit [Pseudomonadota bacterium]
MSIAPKPTGLFARKHVREASRAPRTAKAIIAILSVFLVAAIVWAARTEIRELAKAEGEIVPRGSLTYIEHFDGGVIDRILVAAGDRVEAGQALARLSSPELAQTRNELMGERTLLADHRAMLKALIAGDAAGPVAGSYATTRRDLHLSRMDMLQDRVAGRVDALEIARDAHAVARERLALADRERTRLQTLFDQGHVPRTRLTVQDDLQQRIQSDLLVAKTQLARATSDRTDAIAARAEARLLYEQDLQSELFGVEQDLSRVERRLDEIAQQQDRLHVRTPVSGIVQAVANTTPGEVIDAGERMFEILPTTVGLVAEIRVTPEDIGHISLGHGVSLRPTAFDARRYGQLRGQIERISPTSTLDPQGFPYFSVEVGLEGTTLDRGPFHGEVGAGMVVLAEIETSRRTVLQYLLKPIDQSLAMAMTER